MLHIKLLFQPAERGVLFSESSECIFPQFRERDQLAKIFQTWQQPQSPSCALMPKAWDLRVRQHLGTRYNCKSGSFDWDVTMKLHEKGVRGKFIAASLSVAFRFCRHCACCLQCAVINKHEYVRWRERGLAFEKREGAYQITNPTLISSRLFNQVSSCLSTLQTSPG